MLIDLPPRRFTPRHFAITLIFSAAMPRCRHFRYADIVMLLPLDYFAADFSRLSDYFDPLISPDYAISFSFIDTLFRRAAFAERRCQLLTPCRHAADAIRHFRDCCRHAFHFRRRLSSFRFRY